jgi:hypothetical protein
MLLVDVQLWGSSGRSRSVSEPSPVLGVRWWLLRPKTCGIGIGIGGGGGGRRGWRGALSREEMAAGVACRGCGLAMRDGLGEWRTGAEWAAADQAAFDVASADFDRRHGECAAGRWSLAGSRTWHCRACCPPPPLSIRQVEELGRLVASIKTTAADMDNWELLLTCGHRLVRSQHRENQSWPWRVVDCPQCSSRHGVVTAERTGPVIAAAQWQRLTADLTEARALLERRRRGVAQAEQRVRDLTEEIEQFTRKSSAERRE